MNDIIHFDLENENGFFCVFFFLLSTYIYSCKNNFIVCIKDDNWKFSYRNGFDDYFLIDENKIIKSIAFINRPGDVNNHISHGSFGHMNEPNMLHTLNEYKLYSRELYHLRQDILDSFNLNILPEKYNSIFMRGGDKLLYEAEQHDISNYINFLLSLKLDTYNLFVHSDDNLLVETVEKYIKNKKIGFKVFKITDERSNGGAVVMKRLNYGNCKNILSVDDMNSEQKKTHTLLMLKAVEIMRGSQNVICSFDTNVSRFMKINFDCNVYSINHSNSINFNVKVRNPAYSF